MSDAIKQILVTGGNGQFGTELKRYAWLEGWAVRAIDIDELDLRDTIEIIAMVGASPAIVRTAEVISACGNNFIETLLRVGAPNPTLRVDDQHGLSTSAADLAAALATITMPLMEDPPAPIGTYHISNAGAVTWAGFTPEVIAQSAVRVGASVDVQSITTADYPPLPMRPANSLLSHGAITRDYCIHPPAWQTALGNVLDESNKEIRA